MPAVIRVKRHIDEEPLSAFILNGKKRRLNDGQANITPASGVAAYTIDEQELVGAVGGSDNKDEVSTILKFAGTVTAQDDLTALAQYARLTKEEAKDLIQLKTHKPRHPTERARQEMRQLSHENRFRVVNCLRTTLDSHADDTQNTTTTPLTIVDIEKQNNHNVVPAKRDNNNINSVGEDKTSEKAPAVSGAEQPADSDIGYVYDLYLPENEEQARDVDLMDDHYLSIKSYVQEFWELRDDTNTANDDDDDSDVNDEDSNDENCVGNDYPDEEEFSDCLSFTGEPYDVLRQLDEYNLSDNDDDDDESIYSEDFDNASDISAEYQDPYITATNIENDDFIADIDTCYCSQQKSKKIKDSDESGSDYQTDD